MEAAAGLQTATAAVTIVDLAYRTWRFLQEVANAHEDARLLSRKTHRLFDLVQPIHTRLRLRREARGSQRPTEEERLVEGTVKESLRAARTCLNALDRKMRGLTTDQPISFTTRAAQGFRWTLSAIERRRLESQVENTLVELSTALHLITWLETDDTHNQLAALQRQISAAMAHLAALPPQEEPTQSIARTPSAELNAENLALLDAPSPTTMERLQFPDSPGSTASSFIDPYSEGIKSLRKTIEVAQSVSAGNSSRSNPDMQSEVRVQEDLDSIDDTESLDSIFDNPQPSRDAAVQLWNSPPTSMPPESSRSPSVGASDQLENTVRTGRRPSRLLKRWKEGCLSTARAELARGNLTTAEEHFNRAFEYGIQLEQHESDPQPFVDRRELRQQLVDIYIQQEKYAQAVGVMSNLKDDLPSNEDSKEQVLETVRFWTRFGKVRHCLYLSNKEASNREGAERELEAAEMYVLDEAFSRLEELHESGDISHSDAAWIDCVTLLIKILEDEGKAVEAAECRRECLDMGVTGSNISKCSFPGSEREGDDDDTVAKERKRERLHLLHSPERPPLSNAIVANLEEEFRQILDQTLDSKGDINARSVEQWTPLMYATSCSHVDTCACYKIAQKLLISGADINAVAPAQDGRKETALHQAAARGNEEMVQLLIQKDADKEACSPCTPLVVATKKNQHTIVDMLLKHSANATVTDPDGWTLLHHAVSSTSFNVLETLLLPRHAAAINKDAKGEVRPAVEATDNAMKTPLHFAAERSNTAAMQAIAELLLRSGSDANAEDEQRRSPLMWATSRKNPSAAAKDFVTLLLNFGADPARTHPRWVANFKFYDVLDDFRKGGVARPPLQQSSPARMGDLQARRRDSAASGLSRVKTGASGASGSSAERRQSQSTIRSQDTTLTKATTVSMIGKLKGKLSPKEKKTG